MSSKRYRLARKAKKASITWNDRAAAKPAPFARKLPFYEETKDRDCDGLDGWLYNGALWIAECPLVPGHQPPIPLPYLTRGYDYPGSPVACPIPKGSILMYTGAIHVDERGAFDRQFRIWRHTFLASGVRYIVTDIVDWIYPEGM